MTQAQATLGRPSKGYEYKRTLRQTEETYQLSKAVRRLGESLEDYLKRKVKQDDARNNRTQRRSVRLIGLRRDPLYAAQLAAISAPAPVVYVRPERQSAPPVELHPLRQIDLQSGEGLTARAHRTGELPAPEPRRAKNGTQETRPLSVVPDFCPTAWQDSREQLIAVVSLANYETYLSACRQVSCTPERLTLGVPTAFYQEHLTSNYKEVIQQVTQRKVEFIVIERPTPETPKEELSPTPSKEEPTGEFPGWLPTTEKELDAFYLKEDKQIWEVRTAEDYSRIDNKRMAFSDKETLRLQIKSRREIEDRERAIIRSEQRAQLIARLAPALLRQPGNPQDQRQYDDKEWREAAGEKAKRTNGKKSYGSVTRSPWDTEGGATRRDLKEALKKDPP